MANDLDERLAALADRFGWSLEGLHEAAGIGAEVEREACALLAERMFQEAEWDFLDDFPRNIRARGGK